MIVHDLLPTIDIVNDDTPNGRFYYRPETPETRYPSVTTIIGRSKYSDTSWKSAWIAKVGEAEARSVSLKATRRGTALHDICEKYFRNENYVAGSSPVLLEMFDQALPALHNITKIRGIEHALWSDKYKTAGKADLLCDWNNIPTILDHKTCKSVKSIEDIFTYYIQVTMYALIAQEQTGIPFKHAVIIMYPDKDPIKIYKFKIDKYIPLTEKLYLSNECR